jgi:tetratricopeptide (TPR) repeat protein
LALDPSIHELYNNKGILYQNQGRFEEAIPEYTKAIQLKPDYVNAFINRGNAYSALNRNTEAYNDYNQAITLNPQYGLAFYARALLEIKNAETRKACADLQTAVNLGYTQASEALKVHCQ